MLKLTLEQEQTLRKWIQRGIARRSKPKELLTRMGLEDKHLRTLYRMIKERKTRSGVRHLHTSDKETIKKCKQMRNDRAIAGGYSKVPLSQVAEEMQDDRGECQTFLSPSRVGNASRKSPGSRDPCAAKGQLGDDARRARLKAYLKHHHK